MQEVLKNKITFTNAINICLGKNIHFVAYKLPGEKGISIIIQTNPEIKPLEKLDQQLPTKGFLIAPFHRDNNEAWLIKPDIVLTEDIQTCDLERLNALPSKPAKLPDRGFPPDTGKEEYIQQIRESIENIKEGAFEKVVLSRVKSVKGNFTGRLPAIFETLCATYPNAFVYLFFVEGQCWTGATPEPFICSSPEGLKTVSLAGTRPFREKDMDISNWNNKELQEQEYVTLHIEKILKNFNILHFRKTGPYVARAGNVLHLRTDFTFPVDTIGNRLPSLIAALHPTPAVCGMSTGKAMDFIKNAEKHDRGYYAGFLGPVGFPDGIRLYVNLRCLKVFDDRLVLYIGGGITLDSVPEEEWEETEIKAETLLSVLKQIG
jgi:isochorismate synthase